MAAPQFIAPLVDWLLGLLQGMTPEQYGGLEPFVEFHKSFTGVVMNWPPVSVMPRKTAFDPDTVGASHSKSALTVKFGVNGADPDQVAADAMAYMRAIDAAIEAAPAPAQVTHVHIEDHDYGVLFERAGGFAKFPELHLEVEVYE